MPIEILPITATDLDSAIECIQLAFADDPYHQWVFDSAAFDKSRNRASLQAKCEWGMRCSSALFYVAKETSLASTSTAANKVLGVSMWTTPEATRTGAAHRRSWADWWNDYRLWFAQGVNVLWYRGWGGLRRDRYWVWKREQAVCQDEIFYRSSRGSAASRPAGAEQGFYFVNIVTVRPECQGQGIGRKLFEEVMARADREGKMCYLESSRWEPNVAIYEKLGFEVAKKMRCEAEDGTGEGCDLFCMVRELRTQINAAQ